MTVEQLIEELRKLPSDAQVIIAVGGESSDYIQIDYAKKENIVDLYTT